MGVPAFFSWLTKKYEKIVVDCLEQPPVGDNGEENCPSSVDPDPNNIKFDNLYLDMNNIIHPCTHPENKAAPKNEDEMMIAIFEYIDRLFRVIRPRKLLYMAIDGVAPRAKMNQQRSRRFLAAKQNAEKLEEISRCREELKAKGYQLPPEKTKEEHFDSNCITPGTEFMARLSTCLHFYIHDRLNNDPGWKSIKVILSDANVPGEGEHKIMDYIRKQQAQPDYDPNTQHCICGADADLIMLGLATHEPNFTIIREKWVYQKRQCDLCSRTGHVATDVIGFAEVENDFFICKGSEANLIFVRLCVLREYLELELNKPDFPFQFDLERAVDDWVFMCSFVGNDFLPQLPALDIWEGGIDTLVAIYTKAIHEIKDWLTDSGDVNLDRVQLIMSLLDEAEDSIFKERRNKMFKKKNPRRGSRRSDRRKIATQDQATKNDKDAKSDLEQPDDVRFWEDGYKERYYASKFGCKEDNIEFRHHLAHEYVLGLCWVLKYYYQGCASWKWYFPFHYAPFASDFVNISAVSTEFEKGKPFRPMEQLMSVLPAASSAHVPAAWANLMTSGESEIIDFYQDDFKIDLNGKKQDWQGVVLLPFVNEQRLVEVLEPYYKLLTPQEIRRNITSDNRLYISKHHPGFGFITSLYENENNMEQEFERSIEGMRGRLLLSEDRVPIGGTLSSPVNGLDDLHSNQVNSVRFRDPKYEDDFIFPARRLSGSISPTRILQEKDFMKIQKTTENSRQSRNKNQRSQKQSSDSKKSASKNLQECDWNIYKIS